MTPRSSPSSDSPLPAESPAPGAKSDGQMEAIQIDQQIGEFRLLRRLGQGGMAQVWLAEQTSLHRNVALKLLKPSLMADPNYVRRFQAEAKAAAGLNHPNIVQVYVIGEDAGRHYIAQEYVQGATLKAHLQRKGPLDLQVALHLMRQIAGALQAAGERGIVHRDIKPENIMLTKKGEAKVADFGLAQLSYGGEKMHLTQEGVTMGTPLYMSPEQVSTTNVDVRSDIYSFGVTCYHMLTGRTPFQGETAIRIAMQHVHDAPPLLKEQRPDLPQPVCDLVHRMLAKSPDDRYPDAATLVEDIRKLIRELKDVGKLEQVKLAEIGDEAARRQTFTGRHPVLSLSVLCLLAASASAGVGWWMRPADPRLSPPAADRRNDVVRASSAKQQFLNAMLKVDDEFAFRAVIQYWDKSPDAEPWVARAHEQLAQLYLRNPDRRDEATRELEAMRSVTGTYAEEFQARAWAGEIVLQASQGRIADAQRILQRQRPLLETYHLLPGPPTEEGNEVRRGWSRRIEETLGHTPGLRPPPPPPR